MERYDWDSHFQRLDSRLYQPQPCWRLDADSYHLQQPAVDAETPMSRALETESKASWWLQEQQAATAASTNKAAAMKHLPYSLLGPRPPSSLLG